MNTSRFHSIQLNLSIPVELGDTRRPQEVPIHEELALDSITPHFSAQNHNNYSDTYSIPISNI